MKKLYTSFIIFLSITSVRAQTNIFPSTGAAGVGTLSPAPSSLLEINSTSKGILIPRMTKNQRDAIASPAIGLMIYQTNNAPGFYYCNGTSWVAVSPKGVNKFLSNLSTPTAINTDLLPGNNNANDLGSYDNLWRDLYLAGSVYLEGNINLNNGGVIIADGTTVFNSNSLTYNLFTGNAAGYNNTTGNYNTAIGSLALNNNTSGWGNTSDGAQSLLYNNSGSHNTANGIDALYYNTTGNDNAANGAYSLLTNSTGINNTAIGSQSLYNNTIGNGNTANGFQALKSNTIGYSNIAIGINALNKNTEGHNLVAVGDSALFNQSVGSNGYENTAVGSKALYSNTTGWENTSIGYQSLFYNTSGYQNTTNGRYALYSNTTGDGNTAEGEESLSYNTTGELNVATGYQSLFANNAGSENVAIGFSALSNNQAGSENVAIGSNALSLTLGNDNTALGGDANANGTMYSNGTIIGYAAKGTASNQVRIGNSSVTSIGGYVNWSNISDRRVKKNIKENVPGLVFINKLNPVTYNLDLDAADKIIQSVTTKDKIGKSFQLSQDELAVRKLKEQVVYTGFIAQDVETAAKSLDYDFSGVDAAKNSKDLYGLRYGDFVVPLVKGEQELSSQNDSLKELVTSMQSQIDVLKNALQLIAEKAGILIPSSSASLSSASLEQNIPNPFSTSTTIGYILPHQCSSAQILVRDNLGHTLKQIRVSGTGKGSLNIDASNISSGAYSYSLLVDGRVIDTKKMVSQK